MWSLKQTLANLAAYPPDGYNHLPNGFDPSKGIRVLFPPHKSCGISTLKNYVFSFTGSTETPEGNTAQMLIIADGAGRWGIGAVASLDPLAISWAGGFCFNYSNDANGHGYVVNNANVNAAVVNGFNESWILQNWCDAFPAGVKLWMWDEDSAFVSAFSNPSFGPVNEAATTTNSSFKTLVQFTATKSVQLPPSTDNTPGQDGPRDPFAPSAFEPPPPPAVSP
jgi:hypothetical protein